MRTSRCIRPPSMPSTSATTKRWRSPLATPMAYRPSRCASSISTARARRCRIRTRAWRRSSRGGCWRGSRRVVYEDGRQMRDFVHVSDIVQACCLAMDSAAADYQVLNVGTGRPVSVLEVAELLARELGYHRRIPDYGKVPRRRYSTLLRRHHAHPDAAWLCARAHVRRRRARAGAVGGQPERPGAACSRRQCRACQVRPGALAHDRLAMSSERPAFSRGAACGLPAHYAELQALCDALGHAAQLEMAQRRRAGRHGRSRAGVRQVARRRGILRAIEARADEWTPVEWRMLERIDGSTNASASPAVRPLTSRSPNPAPLARIWPRPPVCHQKWSAYLSLRPTPRSSDPGPRKSAHPELSKDPLLKRACRAAPGVTGETLRGPARAVAGARRALRRAG